MVAEVTSPGEQVTPAQPLSPQGCLLGLCCCRHGAEPHCGLGPILLNHCRVPGSGHGQHCAVALSPRGVLQGLGHLHPHPQVFPGWVCTVMGMDGHTYRAMVHRQAAVKAQQICLMLHYPSWGAVGALAASTPPGSIGSPFLRLFREVKAWRTWLPGGLGEEHMALTALPSLLCQGFDRSSVTTLNSQRLPRLTIC